MTVLTQENAAKELMAVSRDLSEEDAQKIATIWFDVQDYEALDTVYPEVLEIERSMHQPRLIARRGLFNLKCYCINRLLGMHGIEFLGWDQNTKEEITYCNAGDIYAATVFFVVHGPIGHLEVSTVGDMFTERHIRGLSELGELL